MERGSKDELLDHNGSIKAEKDKGDNEKNTLSHFRKGEEETQGSSQLDQTGKITNEGVVDNYKVELQWCIDQLKLGLTNKGVTKEQCTV